MFAISQMDLSEISTSFRAGSDTYGITPYVILTIVPILAAVGITFFYQHHAGFIPSLKGTDRLFLELCQAHKLSRYDARLLRKMATALGDAKPASLFILKHKFDLAAESFQEFDGSTKTATEIASIRGRLFGSLEEKQENGKV